MSRLVLAILPLLLLSGCFVTKDAVTTEIDVAQDDVAPAAGNSTSTSSLGSAPVIANLSLNATGLSVAFTIVGSDADNDTVTWVLAFGDNSSANGTLARTVQINESVQPAGATPLVANVTHMYAAAGVYNATLTLSDGMQLVNQTLVVEAGSATTLQEPIEIKGEVQCLPTIVFNGHRSGGAHEFEVLAGQSTMVLTLTYPENGDFNDLDYTLTPPAGTAKVSDESGPEPPMTVDQPDSGIWNLDIEGYSCVQAVKYTVDVTFS